MGARRGRAYGALVFRTPEPVLPAIFTTLLVALLDAIDRLGAFVADLRRMAQNGKTIARQARFHSQSRRSLPAMPGVALRWSLPRCGDGGDDFTPVIMLTTESRARSLAGSRGPNRFSVLRTGAYQWASN